VLNYSYKRISTYIPKDQNAPHRLLKRIFFIREYLKYLEDKNVEIFVQDEAGNLRYYFINPLGFGTSPFCNYSYALVGEKALKNTPKLTKNVTVCATISK
jgi:hypothetical protein